MTPPPRLAIGSLLAALFLAATVWFALAKREGPMLCPDGFVRSGARCKGPAAAAERRVRFQSSAVVLGGADWEGKPSNSELASVGTYYLDASEVSVARYAKCVAESACPALANQPEAALPVRNVTPAQADAFCRFVGGRLPTGPEWVLAAAGKDGRRFPWGSTGLVCRRAAFGLAEGPCAKGGNGPDAPGSRPDGATPEGVLDLAGNVAELTRDPTGRVLARGGSYLSKSAAELKTWSAAERSGPAPDIGFRCAYPSQP